MVWNEPANLDAVLYLKHTRDDVIRFCEIRGARYSGVSQVGSAQRVKVYRSHIHDGGYHGVLLLGYSPPREHAARRG